MKITASAITEVVRNTNSVSEFHSDGYFGNNYESLFLENTEVLHFFFTSSQFAWQFVFTT